MTSTNRILVVVADGEHARMLVRGDKPDSYRTERSFDSTTAHQRSSDLGTEAPGRSFESAGTLRHSIAPKTDLHEEAKRSFIVEVARQVNEAASQGAFDRLVLVAPAHALHDLRLGLSAGAAERLVGILQKDLVNTPDAAISSHLTYDVLHSAP